MSIQRAATLADAGIDIGGLNFGGSGTLLKSVFKQTGKEAGKQATKKGVKHAVKELVIDAIKEGGEEATQTLLGDIADDSKLNTGIDQYVTSGVLGALGGATMHGAGKAISDSKGVVNQAIQNNVDNRIAQQMATNPRFVEAVAKRKQEIKQQVQLAQETQTNQEQINVTNPKQKASPKMDASEMGSAYDPIKQEIFSYDNQDIANIQQTYAKHGDNFYDRLSNKQRAIYESLLDNAQKDQEGRYKDPITGSKWIDKIVDYDGRKAVKTEYQATDINNRAKIRDDILTKFGNKEISLNEINQKAGVTKKSAGKLAGKSYSTQPLGHIGAKVNSAMHIDELGLTMTNVQIESNAKNQQKKCASIYQRRYYYY